MHFMHSMNWVRDVKGANHLDLLLGKMAAVAGGVDEDDLHFMNQVRSQPMALNRLGWHSLF